MIAHAVWLYFRFPLSLRIVEDMLAARGIIISHETVRLWAGKFGRHFVNDIRKRSVGRHGDKWYLDEVVIAIGANTGCGALSIRMASSSTSWCKAAVTQKLQKRLMHKLLNGQGRSPHVMITDNGAAKREIMPAVEHCSHTGLNNRAENSHPPVRRRERMMKLFKPRQLQRLVSIHGPIA